MVVVVCLASLLGGIVGVYFHTLNCEVQEEVAVEAGVESLMQSFLPLFVAV